MPMSVRFRLKSTSQKPKPNQLHPLQIRLTVEDDRDSNYATLPDRILNTAPFLPIDQYERKLFAVEPRFWDQKGQRRRDREGFAFNNLLERIRVELFAVYRRQKEAGIEPTRKTVWEEFYTGEKYVLDAASNPETVVGAFTAYLAYQDSLTGKQALSAVTRKKYGYTLDYLKQYLSESARPELLIKHLTASWGKRFHAWLMCAGPMAEDSATRHLVRLSDALDYLIQNDAPISNPLALVDWPRAGTKEVYWLNEDQRQRFWELQLPGMAGITCHWFGIMMLTGLDYYDAVEYVQNRTEYDRQIGEYTYIYYKRKKTDGLQYENYHGKAVIPLLPELAALLKFPPTEYPNINTINRFLKVVQVMIGFPHELTTKTARKTAGAIFIEKGITLESVSRILGHSSVSVTERHYVKITDKRVIRDTEHLFR